MNIRTIKNKVLMAPPEFVVWAIYQCAAIVIVCLPLLIADSLITVLTFLPPVEALLTGQLRASYYFVLGYGFSIMFCVPLALYINLKKSPMVRIKDVVRGNGMSILKTVVCGIFLFVPMVAVFFLLLLLFPYSDIRLSGSRGDFISMIATSPLAFVVVGPILITALTFAIDYAILYITLPIHLLLSLTRDK